MSDTVIQVEKLSKKYTLFHQKKETNSTLRDALTDGAKSFNRKLFKSSNDKVPDIAHEDFLGIKGCLF